MPATVTLNEAQAKLKELIHNMSPGEEIVITVDEHPVARLVANEKTTERKLGTLKGTVLHMAPDFDAPLDDFKEYME